MKRFRKEVERLMKKADKEAAAKPVPPAAPPSSK